MLRHVFIHLAREGGDYPPQPKHKHSSDFAKLQYMRNPYVQSFLLSYYTLKEKSAKFLSFNMLIGALDGALIQNLCPVPHFNPKL